VLLLLLEVLAGLSPLLDAIAGTVVAGRRLEETPSFVTGGVSVIAAFTAPKSIPDPPVGNCFRKDPLLRNESLVAHILFVSQKK
jgi:hypothetical protein